MTFTASGRRFTAMVPRQLAAVLRWTTLSDGTVVAADDAAYHFVLIEPGGVARLRVRRDGPPRPTTEAVRDSIRARIRRQAEADQTAPGFVEQRLEKLTFAEVVPWITGLRADHRDRIWVGVSVNRPGLTDRVDVYGRDGDYVGSLELSDLPDTFLSQGRAAFLSEDPATGVQRVVVTALRGHDAR